MSRTIEVQLFIGLTSNLAFCEAAFVAILGTHFGNTDLMLAITCHLLFSRIEYYMSPVLFWHGSTINPLNHFRDHRNLFIFLPTILPTIFLPTHTATADYNCRYNAVQYIMISHTAKRWQQQNILQIMNWKKTPHGRAMGCLLWGFWRKLITF